MGGKQPGRPKMKSDDASFFSSIIHFFFLHIFLTEFSDLLFVSSSSHSCPDGELLKLHLEYFAFKVAQTVIFGDFVLPPPPPVVVFRKQLRDCSSQRVVQP